MELDNHKETFKLLNVSESDSVSDIPEFKAPRRKVKIKRKIRPSNGPKLTKRNCTSALAWKVFGTTAVLVLFVIVTWFVVNLYEKIDQINRHLQEVEAGTRQTPEEFHNIHTQLKSLESNATQMWKNISSVTSELDKISRRIESLTKTATSLTESIAAAPEIKTLPSDVKSLQQSVAELGSKITEIKTSFDADKEQTTNTNKNMQNKLESLQAKVQSFSTSIQSTTLTPSTSFNSEVLEKSIEDINRTLSLRIKLNEEETSFQKAEILLLQNSSNSLVNRVETIDAKCTNLTLTNDHLHEAVYETLNQTVCNNCNNSNMFVNSSVSPDELFAYVKNLTQVYNALLDKFTEFQKESENDLNTNLLNKNTTHAMEKIIRDSVASFGPKFTAELNNCSEQYLLLNGSVTNLQLILNDLMRTQHKLIREVADLQLFAREMKGYSTVHRTPETSPKISGATVASFDGAPVPTTPSASMSKRRKKRTLPVT